MYAAMALDLPAYQPDPSTIRVLFVSDLHLNPASWDVIRSVAKQFQGHHKEHAAAWTRLGTELGVLGLFFFVFAVCAAFGGLAYALRKAAEHLSAARKLEAFASAAWQVALGRTSEKPAPHACVGLGPATSAASICMRSGSVS